MYYSSSCSCGISGVGRAQISVNLRPSIPSFAKAEGKAATTWHGRHGSSTQDAPRGQSRRCGRREHREHRATSAHEEPDDHGGAAAAQVVVVQGAARALGLQTASRRGGSNAPKPRRAGERGKGSEGTTRAAAHW